MPVTKTIPTGPAEARARAQVNPFKGEPIGATGLVVYLDVFGGWRWERHHGDGEVRDSPMCYDTRADCLADAARRGFLAPAAADAGGARAGGRKPSVRPALSLQRAGAAHPVAAPAIPERELTPGVV